MPPLELSIRTQPVRIGWYVEDGQPKADAGERPVALDHGTFACAAGPAGSPRRRTRHHEADLPPIRLHDLRHGAATLALVVEVYLHPRQRRTTTSTVR